ncbi:hypothetical protein C4K03_4804 [Pseudomonas synxantha]|uniref:Uncharacterized protein n=1 Tax=Pseudomonas synxantha TaxID=47883 RepID=A0A3G7UEH7_9PSED|nr:hypothetical protein C4K03_4804 [Pseudomonas synxantha]
MNRPSRGDAFSRIILMNEPNAHHPAYGHDRALSVLAPYAR